MRNTKLRALAWGLALGCLGFLAVLLGFWASQFVPGLPVAASMALTRHALVAGTDPLPPGRAEWILSATHWYREAALPALIAVLLGGLVGLLRRPAPFEAVVAGVSFAILSTLLIGSPSSATWIGFISFLFCLLGAETLTQGFVSAARQPGEGRRSVFPKSSASSAT